MLPTVTLPVLRSLRRKRILVVDDCRAFLKQSLHDLTEAGFLEVEEMACLDNAHRVISETSPDVLLVDSHCTKRNGHDGLVVIREAVEAGYPGRPVIVSSDEDLDQFYRALAAGVHDYWCKGPNLNLSREVIGLLTRPPTDALAPWDSKNIGRLGYFRTRGLPASFQRVLLEYASDFARYREVAARLKRSPKQIKKALADAQDRLGTVSQGNLAKLLTACELMGRRPYATIGRKDLAGRKRTGSIGESQFRLIHQSEGESK